MHAAPAVRYPVTRSYRIAAWLAGLCALELALLLAWWVSSPQGDVLHAAAFAVWGIAAAWAALAWRRSATGTLAWDGQHWRWESARQVADVPEGTAHIHLDLQTQVLVRFVPGQGRAVWLWLGRQPGRLPQWHLLRCALYAADGSAGSLSAGQAVAQ